ncbi:MAG: hypothetical protein FWE45_02085 [Firmicutes bacterium]|nr:hypothetical protein [Bacillota bacterium]
MDKLRQFAGGNLDEFGNRLDGRDEHRYVLLRKNNYRPTYNSMTVPVVHTSESIHQMHSKPPIITKNHLLYTLEKANSCAHDHQNVYKNLKTNY